MFFVKPIIEKEEIDAVNSVLQSGNIAQGEKTAELEQRFADYCGCKYAVAVNSGTAALHASLFAAGVEEGDEVISTPFSFVATANAVLMQKATLVFSDISEVDFNIDSCQIPPRITKKTKAILPVDLFGQVYDYIQIKKTADMNGLTIIEDACQAVGSTYQGKKAGTFGDLGCFSFYATKNMTTGEGGMIVTDDEVLAMKCKRFRHHGQDMKRYQYLTIGYNYRMSDLNAAIGLEQLKKVDAFNSQRNINAQIYHEALEGVKGIICPFLKSDEYFSNYHQYTIRVTKDFKMTRDQLKEHLAKKKIPTAVFYPTPLHLSPHFKQYGYCEGDFPVAERMAREVLSLPVYPMVPEKEIRFISEMIKKI